jgi:ribonuclease D
MEMEETQRKEPPPPFIWVATAESFERMHDEIIPASRVAIDIEADSLYHYSEKVCLLQISTDHRTFIVDPLAVKNIRDLSPLMKNPKIEKVFHAAAYDIFCLRRDFGFKLVNLFDTHIAAQFLGFEQLGLDVLLEKVLGVTHSKRRQRDDWSRRPLTPDQLQYAAMDTSYLLQLRDRLQQRLAAKRREAWAQEEFQAMEALKPPDRKFDPEGFRNIKGSRGLPVSQRAALRALYVLRDRFAREMDVPPFKVMNNAVMVSLVQSPPASPRDMFRRPGISYRVARRFAGEICRAIEGAHKEDRAAEAAPARTGVRPPPREAKARLEKLKRWRRVKADELQLSVGVVFPGTLLETMAVIPPADLTSFQNIEGMRRWRAKEFGGDLLKILHDV